MMFNGFDLQEIQPAPHKYVSLQTFGVFFSRVTYEFICRTL